MIADLFKFAYIGNWFDCIDALALKAMPEPWSFLPVSENVDTRKNIILERYINAIFRKQAIEYSSLPEGDVRDGVLCIQKNCACLDTGLVTPYRQAIYMVFDHIRQAHMVQEWTFRGFCVEGDKALGRITRLPLRPQFECRGLTFDYMPEIPIRLDMGRILDNEISFSRIPEKLRNFPALSLMIEASVELARRDAYQAPEDVVIQYCQAQIQYLLPMYLEDVNVPTLALSLTVENGYYLGHTLLPLEMAYSNARVIARPNAHWLRKLVAS